MKVNLNSLHNFIVKLFEALNFQHNPAKIISDNVLWCEMIERKTHGIIRLPILVKRIELGLITTQCNLSIEKKSDCIELIDAHNGMGHYASYIAAIHACEIAKRTGVGLVGVTNSNFFGIAAYYINQMANQQCLGFAMSNSFPQVAAYNGLKAIFGTNPFGFGAPVKNEQNILIDMATAACSGSLIRKYAYEGKLLPEGIAIDDDGEPITDPNLVQKGCLLPFGGPKGYALGLMLEILCGVITGAGISHQVGSMYRDLAHPSNNGHFFLAIDISRLMPLQTYYERVNTLVGFIKASGSDSGKHKILIPGEKRWRAYENAKQNGIELDEQAIEIITKLGEDYQILLPW